MLKTRKKLPCSAEGKRLLVDVGHPDRSVRRPCELLGLSRASLYDAPVGEGTEDLAMLERIDAEDTEHPVYGSRRMTAWLRSEGDEVNRKRVRRLMGVMGLAAIYARPRTTVAGRGHRIYPYLLRGVSIDRVDQVWSADITSIPMVGGFMYLSVTSPGVRTARARK